MSTRYYIAAIVVSLIFAVIIYHDVYVNSILSNVSEGTQITKSVHSSALDAKGLTIQSVLEYNDEYEPIRSWGCSMNAVPFIFVHIGKAGGGNARRMIANAARNIKRSAHNWVESRLDHHFYPVPDAKDPHLIHHAKFCSSQRTRHIPVSVETFEGRSQRCTATTPLGHMIACPELFNRACPYDPSDPESAYIVYVGHNLLGSEIHWLPKLYLRKWWRRHWLTPTTDKQEKDEIFKMLSTLDGKKPWCDNFTRPVLESRIPKPWKLKHLLRCSRDNLEQRVDTLAYTAQQKHFADPLQDPVQRGRANAQLYASMPVLRVTLVREPFSWLSSKYAWHRLAEYGLSCDDIATATDFPGYTNLHSTIGVGWARLMALQYILFLCGVDCFTRLEAGQATLEEVEAQAAYNLRQSFAVVGILEESDTFYEMIHFRVAYMNMHAPAKLLADDGDHQSEKDPHCDAMFKNYDFQRKLIAHSPEMASLLRLYEIALEVNKFQTQELQKCNGARSLIPCTEPWRRLTTESNI